jgi:ketosteroid isomerase-like protein
VTGSDLPPLAVVRAFFDALARGDVPAVLAALDPQVVWARTVDGPDAVVGSGAVLEEVLAPWLAAGVGPGGYRATGDDVVVAGLDVPAVHVVRLHAGRIARVDQLAQPAEGDLR